MYAAMHVCMCTYVCVYVHVCIHVYIYVGLYVWYTYVYVCVYTCINVYMYVVDRGGPSPLERAIEHPLYLLPKNGLLQLPQIKRNLSWLICAAGRAWWRRARVGFHPAARQYM